MRPECGPAADGGGGGELQPPPWQEGDELHLDLRGLVPPQPLVSILRLLRALDAQTDLIVHLDRDPVLLYPELEALQRHAVPLDGAAGEVRLRLTTRPGRA